MSYFEFGAAAAGGGRWYLPVRWDRADDLRRRLHRRGVPTTLCIDPAAPSARLELWPGVDPDRAAAALAAVAAEPLFPPRAG